MESIYYFIVEPKGEKYNNKTESGLIVNTRIENHNYVNRVGIVKAIPTAFNTDIKVGDEVILNHNVFRRYTTLSGVESESTGTFNDKQTFVGLDEIYFRKEEGKWVSVDDRCMVLPIVNTDRYSLDERESLVGILHTIDNSLEQLKMTPGDVVGFTPESEYEFNVDGLVFYCMRSRDICIKYENKRNEIKYNPSWSKSS